MAELFGGKSFGAFFSSSALKSTILDLCGVDAVVSLRNSVLSVLSLSDLSPPTLEMKDSFFVMLFPSFC